MGHMTFNGNALSMIKTTVENAIVENPGHVTFGKDNEAVMHKLADKDGCKGKDSLPLSPNDQKLKLELLKESLGNKLMFEL